MKTYLLLDITHLDVMAKVKEMMVLCMLRIYVKNCFTVHLLYSY